MDAVPGYVPAVFFLTTFATVAFLLLAVKNVGLEALPSRILIFLLPLWILFQAVIGIGGFYQVTEGVMPPRIALVGVLPADLLIVIYLVFFREQFIDKLPLKLLTLLHVVRIPVELVLYWLSLSKAIPELMTFAGRNFDILSGILSPIVYFLSFRGDRVNRGLLIAYNVLGLILLANIVTIAILSFPTPMQQLAFDQPNRAVLYFPYVWLPAIVVPVVLFAHLASLWKLVTSPNL